MNQKITLGAAAAVLAFTQPARSAITGQWEFNSLASAVGQPIEYFDGAGGATQGQTQFGTTTSFGISDVNGQAANVMKFGANQPAMGYSVPHGLPANGGFNVNQWSIVMDVLFPADSTGKWRALLQTDVSNPPDDDAEFYLNEANGFGIGGAYSGNVAANTWVRLALAADLTGDAPVIRKYINGVKVGDHTGALDGRFALTPDSSFLLFTDGYEGGIYTAPGYINSLQVHNEALSDAYIAALGGPSAAGIPTDVQTKPFVSFVTPAAGPGASPEIAYSARIENGVTQLNTNSVRLSLNGEAMTPLISVSNNIATVSYSAPQLFPSGSTQNWQLVYADNAASPALSTNTVQIVVTSYVDIKLPTPVFFENFESVAEGSLPTGWTNESFVDIPYPEEDLRFLNSASFARWLVIDAQRFTGTFGTYDDPAGEDTDYQRVLLSSPSYVQDGQLVKNFADRKFAFNTSGYRQGGASQIFYLSTPDVDLSGKTNVHLAFNSIYEQNQDSIAGVEFSTDQGQTWKPVLYMINQGDIIRTNEVVDVTATLTNEYTDVARFPDGSGGTYGSFIGAPLASVLPGHISGRLDDDPRESKRIELLRLAGADNQSKVRLRFLHAGTDSWYFGIDNVGLYSIVTVEPPYISQHPAGATVVEGNIAVFSVQAVGTGLSYQWHFAGQPLPGQTNASLRVDPAQAANAGEYFVRVTNAGGAVESARAVLTITPRPAAVLGVWNFDGNLNPGMGAGTLAYATTETQGAVSFKTTDGTTVPHIGGQPATYLDVGLLPAGAHGVHLTMPTAPNGAEAYVNQYSMGWDVFVPAPIGWTPLFNSAPDNGNDADFYVDDTGRLGIGALGYSPADSIKAGQWHRVIFAADLLRGEVSYYLDGALVYKRTGESLRDGRFALYSGNDAGPDVLLFSEPTGSYNHPLLVSSFAFVDRTLTPLEAAALGGPKASGFAFAAPLMASISRSGNNVVVRWTGGAGTVQVQKATRLTNPDWQSIPLDQGGASATDAITGQAAFYRVVAQ